MPENLKRSAVQKNRAGTAWYAWSLCVCVVCVWGGGGGGRGT